MGARTSHGEEVELAKARGSPYRKVGDVRNAADALVGSIQ
jgi:hypothetical protein